MKKEKVYIILIVFLVVINVVQLGAKYVFPKPLQNIEGKNLRDEVPKLLDLDEVQTQAFFDLAKDHRNKMNSLQKHQQELTVNYINNSSASTLDEITDLHRQKIVLTENHFNDVYSILNEQQKVNFSKFKQAVFQKINK